MRRSSLPCTGVSDARSQSGRRPGFEPDRAWRARSLGLPGRPEACSLCGAAGAGPGNISGLRRTRFRWHPRGAPSHCSRSVTGFSGASALCERSQSPSVSAEGEALVSCWACRVAAPSAAILSSLLACIQAATATNMTRPMASSNNRWCRSVNHRCQLGCGRGRHQSEGPCGTAGSSSILGGGGSSRTRNDFTALTGLTGPAAQSAESLNPDPSGRLDEVSDTSRGFQGDRTVNQGKWGRMEHHSIIARPGAPIGRSSARTATTAVPLARPIPRDETAR